MLCQISTAYTALRVVSLLSNQRQFCLERMRNTPNVITISWWEHQWSLLVKGQPLVRRRRRWSTRDPPIQRGRGQTRSVIDIFNEGVCRMTRGWYTLSSGGWPQCQTNLRLNIWLTDILMSLIGLIETLFCTRIPCTMVQIKLQPTLYRETPRY